MIVVFGASGFIGSYLVEGLRKHKRKVFAVGSNEKTCDWNADITNVFDFHHLPNKNIKAVINCAAALMIDQKTPQQYYDVNAIGTYNVLEYCRKIGAMMVYPMTHSDVNASQDLIITEESPRYFTVNSYGTGALPFITSKIAGAELVEAYNRSGLVHGLVLRIANVRGVGSKDTKYNCVFHQFIEKAKVGETIDLWGMRKTVRDLIYVKDVVRAIIMAIDNNAKPGLYNIGTGKGLTIEDEAEAIISVFSPEKKRSLITYSPEKEEVRKHSSIFDINKACMEFGWLPIYNYHSALEDMKKIMNNGG
ncbi:MAG: NAD(P)-dependent oxidoreductase [Candidatus Colwellbacteria bacterium]|nr:NAD(P)-dependent oxidoreductase [Candidatus Colwellbacteria bacterium]